MLNICVELIRNCIPWITLNMMDVPFWWARSILVLHTVVSMNFIESLNASKYVSKLQLSGITISKKTRLSFIERTLVDSFDSPYINLAPTHAHPAIARLMTSRLLGPVPWYAMVWHTACCLVCYAFEASLFRGKNFLIFPFLASLLDQNVCRHS